MERQALAGEAVGSIRDEHRSASPTEGGEDADSRDANGSGEHRILRIHKPLFPDVILKVEVATPGTYEIALYGRDKFCPDPEGDPRTPGESVDLGAWLGTISRVQDE